jgi:23S rRNA (guanosine2251-2'-O)-methyltransferase
MRKLKNEELNRKSVEEFRSSEKLPLIIVLDNVRSMNNIGSVYRTADAFSCEAVYLCGITATPPHREIEKTALGATESVQWKYFKTTIEAVEELRKQQYLVIAVEQAEGSVPLNTFSLLKTGKYAIVFGHEMLGVSDEVMEKVDAAIEVPQYGTKHSLNISVCAGIVIWEFFQKIVDTLE